MSLTGALSNALTGLKASSRQASVVASNIANATNESYGRREVTLSARGLGTTGGVTVDGVDRQVNRFLLGDWRMSEATRANAGTTGAYHTRLEGLMGTPEEAYSITGRIVAFEDALVEAASRPDLAERLTIAVDAAQSVVDTFHHISAEIQVLREEADSEINAAVTRANTLLEQIQELNVQVQTSLNKYGEANASMDQRQALINELAEIVPVIEAPRGHGAVALYTPGGAVLLDGTAARLEFSRTNTITADMTLGANLLSGLQINGVPINTDRTDGPVGGGRLAALFQIRDTLAVEAQARLDVSARDMIERFQDAGLDTTRAPGDPGLFTDGGAAFLPADEVGISARMQLNAIVDPAQGGAVWHMRAGLGATVPGSVGDAELLQDMVAALSERRVPSSALFGTSGISANALAASVQSFAGVERNISDQGLSFANIRESELKERLLAEGVDTDQEMQRLLLIEQSYAANARLVQTVEAMLDILMGI